MMSNNYNDPELDRLEEELEAQWLRVAQGLEKKYWGKIDIPFTLHEGLSNYTKDELTEIRRNLNLKNVSQLKKAELISVLEEKIVDFLPKLSQLWDEERFKLMTRIVSQGGFVSGDDYDLEQLTYFRNTGIFFTGTYNGKRIIAIPEDLFGIINSLRNELKIRSIIKRNTEWINLSRGLLYYYGALKPSKLIDFLQSYLKEEVDFFEFYPILFEATVYREDIEFRYNYITHADVMDPIKVENEQNMRKDIPYYPFTKRQLFEASRVNFIDRNKHYNEFFNFLTQQFIIDKDDAEDIIDEIIFLLKNDASTNEIIQDVFERFEFKNEKAVQSFMDILFNFMNNTRQWILKGHTSNEVFEYEKRFLQPLTSTKEKKQTTKKVGRNDPCPCGSGKKYKKCCGA